MSDKTESQYYNVIARAKNIFIKKNKDYGVSWALFRMPSITDQILIKAERIRSIQEKKENKVGDSIEGELLAILNYCIMALVLLEVRDQHEANFPESWKKEEKLSKLYDEKVKLTFETMLKKNHDYGEAWRKMRVSSMIDLILVKLHRLKQIEDNEGTTIISEKEDGHYIDILNYAVFCSIKLMEGYE